VAYTDTDGNDFYSVGEGRGGVQIAAQLLGGATTTVTTDAPGGYDTKLVAGTYNVTMSGGGLGRLRDGALKQFTTADGLSSDFVQALYLDHDGVLWIGTYDGGLSRYQGGRFVNYTPKEGLYNDGVFQILEDGNGYFWMSCNRGIYRVSKKELNDFAASSRGRSCRFQHNPIPHEAAAGSAASSRLSVGIRRFFTAIAACTGETRVSVRRRTDCSQSAFYPASSKECR